MEDQLKDILADYLKIEPFAIVNDTVIDRSAVGNSILLHRLYATFSQQGYSVSNYNTIRTFGELKSRLSQNSLGVNKGEEHPALSKDTLRSLAGERHSVENSIGVDIEDIGYFEVAEDYREHSFYKKNFTNREISYCLLQPNSRASFAGLFAAKEALIKADNSLRGTDFNEIEIHHDKSGRPAFKNFLLSISHSDGVAIAIAFLPNLGIQEYPSRTEEPAKSAVNSLPEGKRRSPILYVTFILSLLALVLAILSFLKH